MDGRTAVLSWFSSGSSEMPRPDNNRRTSQEERRASPECYLPSKDEEDIPSH